MESNEIVVLLRRITILRDLHRIEAELCFQVCRPVLGIPNRLAIFRPQLRVLDRDGRVDCRVASDIRCIMRQCAQREGVLVDILTFEHQFTNEVSAANVMHQVAELFTAERVVAQILDDGAPIGIRVRLFELVLRQARIALEQQGPDLVSP